MKLGTKYQISAIDSYREKYLGRTEVKQYTPSPFGEQGYKNNLLFRPVNSNFHFED
jgi:hypothetical protein